MSRRIKLGVLSIILITLLCLSMSFGQTSRQSPRKFDEYLKCRRDADRCITEEDEWARIDSLGNVLIGDSSLQAYVVGYNGRDALQGTSLRHANYVRNLLRRWVADDTRVHVVYGGLREQLTIELWVVPSGVFAPSPSPSFPSEQRIDSVAQKYDEYPYSLYDENRPDLFAEYEHYNQSAVLDGFAMALESEPTARGFIIAYDGQGDRWGASHKLAEKDRLYIYETTFVGELSRIVVVNGGRRRVRSAELWIVPSGATIPKPTPATQGKRHAVR